MFKILAIIMLVVTTIAVPPVGLITLPLAFIALNRMSRRVSNISQARDAYLDQEELKARRKAARSFR